MVIRTWKNHMSLIKVCIFLKLLPQSLHSCNVVKLFEVRKIKCVQCQKNVSTNKIQKRHMQQNPRRIVGCYSWLLSQRISVLSYTLSCALHEFLFEQLASTDKNNFVSSSIVIIIGKSYISKVTIGFFLLIHMVGR